jgi:hypothetical protein
VKTDRSKVRGVHLAGNRAAVMVVAMAASMWSSAARPGVASRPALWVQPSTGCVGDAGASLPRFGAGSTAGHPAQRRRPLPLEASIMWGALAADSTSPPTTPGLQAADHPRRTACRFLHRRFLHQGCTDRLSRA